MKNIPISEMTHERLRVELQNSINGNSLLKARIENLEAKVSRLTNRGIEDMLDTIATLEEDVRQRGALELDALGKIAGLEAELEKRKKSLMHHREALDIFQRLRLLYEYSRDMMEPQTRSAASYMLKQCEESLRLSDGRRKDEYIHKLHVDIDGFVGEIERLKAELAITLPESEQSNE